MARFGVWVAVAVAAVVGCEPPKELPDVVPKTERSNDGPKIPTESEPAAKAYIDRAVLKLTGGKPELLAKGRVSRAVFKGHLQKQGETASEVLRTVAAVWPDRFTGINQSQSGANKSTISAYLHRPHIVIDNNGVEVSPPSASEVERNFAADETAQYWMPLLLPATDPKAIVYDSQSHIGTTPDTGKPLPIHLVRVALAELPVYQLTFDAETDLLVRVNYENTEQGVRYRKQWTGTLHKTGPDGLTLPTKIEFRLGDLRAEWFDVEKWEFPASINDAEFSPPKK